jgi:hypothetical protein
MVNDFGQLYTIEGVAAAILIVVTAYLVISTTTIITPQDVHIIDMQLQQLGNDALMMMDTPDTYGNESERNQSVLSRVISENDKIAFQEQFLSYLTSKTYNETPTMTYAFNATVYYRDNSGIIQSYIFSDTPYYRENAIKVSRWVYLPNGANMASPMNDLKDGKPHSVLLEVLLWRI